MSPELLWILSSQKMSILVSFLWWQQNTLAKATWGRKWFAWFLCPSVRAVGAGTQGRNSQQKSSAICLGPHSRASAAYAHPLIAQNHLARECCFPQCWAPTAIRTAPCTHFTGWSNVGDSSIEALFSDLAKLPQVEN